ncbi:MAG: adenosylmethionine--8-amino-7-oxononanoate transaminase [Gemmatimonadetes bacterium]|nr:adenosylmethionine--8-amino-7-oxononanoate transaminase [Gemmatimonadota bacterium]
MRSDQPHPNLWYPYSPIGGMPVPLRVVRGRGAHLELEDGRTLLDCISSWWVNLHGHANPRIAAAIRDQAERLEHVIFAGFTHEPAERLAEVLTTALPAPLSRVFYSDDGSTAVEVALKMACQYWRNRGEARRSFLAFEGAYHGDTFGAMAAGARSVFTETYTELLFEVVHLPFPATWIGDEGVAAREAAALGRLEAALEAEPARYAALVVEPLVQGAGGMRMCRPEFLRGVERLARAHGVLLVFDEVMTGFGRSGDWFACARADVRPDLICLAKGLTGGFLPMAATVASAEIYEAFVSPDPGKALWHGHSYTANPLGCAAALASFELLVEAEAVFRGMETHHLRFLESLDGTIATKPRVTGTIAAFDLETGEPGYLNRVRDAVRERALDRGLLLRPLGNTVYLMPPYCITDEERQGMYSGVRAVVEEITHLAP